MLYRDINHANPAQRSNFLTKPIPFCEVIVCNPPYAGKGQWIRKLYESGIPFVALLPIESLYLMNERDCFIEFGVLIVVPSKSMFFYKNGDKTKEVTRVGETVWFCGNFPRDICPEAGHINHIFLSSLVDKV